MTNKKGEALRILCNKNSYFIGFNSKKLFINLKFPISKNTMDEEDFSLRIASFKIFQVLFFIFYVILKFFSYIKFFLQR